MQSNTHNDAAPEGAAAEALLGVGASEAAPKARLISPLLWAFLIAMIVPLALQIAPFWITAAAMLLIVPPVLMKFKLPRKATT